MKKIIVLLVVSFLAMGVVALATNYNWTQPRDGNGQVMTGSAYNPNTSLLYSATQTLIMATASIIDVGSDEVLAIQYINMDCTSLGSSKIGPAIGHTLLNSKWIIGIASNGMYIDQTSAAQGTGNLTMFETSQATEGLIIGASETFSQVFFDVSTVAANADTAYAYASFTYYYYDGIGATWTQLTSIENESNYGVATSAATGILFIPPVRWTAAVLSERIAIATSTWYAGYASQSKFMDHTTEAQGGTTGDFTLFSAGGNSATNGFIIGSPSSFSRIDIILSQASGRSNATSSFYYYNGTTATWTALTTTDTAYNWNNSDVATSITFIPPRLWTAATTLTEWSTMPTSLFLIKAIANGNGVSVDTKATTINISSAPSTTERYWFKIVTGGLGTSAITRASTVYVNDPLELKDWGNTNFAFGVYGISPIVLGTRGSNAGEGLVYYCGGNGSTTPNITVFGNKLKY